MLKTAVRPANVSFFILTGKPYAPSQLAKLGGILDSALETSFEIQQHELAGCPISSERERQVTCLERPEWVRTADLLQFLREHSASRNVAVFDDMIHLWPKAEFLFMQDNPCLLVERDVTDGAVGEVVAVYDQNGERVWWPK